jgi:hypothetical protein
MIRMSNTMRSEDQSGIADDASDAIHASCANELGWEPESPTQFERADGVVRVERIRPGSWGAYRSDNELMDSRGQQAIFSNRQRAQHAADIHADDHFKSTRVDDGLYWSKQSVSHRAPRVARLYNPSAANSREDAPAAAATSHPGRQNI